MSGKSKRPKSLPGPVWVGARRQVVIDPAPRCDFCVREARYDAASFTGAWGYFCETHFASLGNGKLGVGYGQEIVQNRGAS